MIIYNIYICISYYIIYIIIIQYINLIFYIDTHHSTVTSFVWSGIVCYNVVQYYIVFCILQQGFKASRDSVYLSIIRIIMG